MGYNTQERADYIRRFNLKTFAVNVTLDENGKKVVRPPQGWQNTTESNPQIDAPAFGVLAPGASYKDGTLVVIDLDNHDKTIEGGVDYWDRMRLPRDTFTVRTASGGQHLYFLATAEQVEKLKGYGNNLPGQSEIYWDHARRFFFGATSVINGNKYEIINNSDPSPLPDTILLLQREAFNSKREKQTPAPSPVANTGFSSGVIDDDELDGDDRRYILDSASRYLSSCGEYSEFFKLMSAFKHAGFTSSEFKSCCPATWDGVDNYQVIDAKWQTIDDTSTGGNIAGLGTIIKYCVPDWSDYLKEKNRKVNKDAVAMPGYYDNADPAVEPSEYSPAEKVEEAEPEPKPRTVFDIIKAYKSGKYKPFKTGLDWFDSLLGGGILPQSLVLLMASPSCGKTSLALQISESIARAKYDAMGNVIKEPRDVVYICLEMSDEQLVAKLLSMRLARWWENLSDKENLSGEDYRLSAGQIMQGHDWTEAREKIIETAGEQYDKEIGEHLVFNPSQDFAVIDGEKGEKNLVTALNNLGERAYNNGKEPPLVVLDYVHIVGSKDGRMDEKEIIKKTCMALKIYACQYKTAVIAIGAVNRTSGRGQVGLDAGRDSSNLEYSADVALSLSYWAHDQGWMDKVANAKPGIGDTYLDVLSRLQNEPYRRLILRVLKGRMGETGKSRKLYFNTLQSTFYDGEYKDPLTGEKSRDPHLPADATPIDFDDDTVLGRPHSLVLQAVDELAKIEANNKKAEKLKKEQEEEKEKSGGQIELVGLEPGEEKPKEIKIETVGKKKSRKK